MPEQLAFNMDCLEAMRQMEDNAFDLAVVDPPYGDGGGSFNFDKQEERFAKHTAQTSLFV